MEKIEITAKTVEDAITEASLKLGVTSDKLDYEVIEEGSAGFLGIGKKNAVIMACVKGEKKEAPAEKPEKKEKKEKKKEEKKPEDKKTEKASEPVKKNKRPAKKITPSKPKAPKEVVPVTEENIKETEAYLKAITEKMGLEATITSRQEEDNSLYMEVSGEDMGLLIGKRGQTLDALQFIINRAAGRRQNGSIRIKLDTENYRERRKKTLENLAHNVAAKAKKTNRNVVLEPMNPYERMIIHSTLQDDPDVVTYSKGKEPYRTVVVALDRKE